MSKRTRLKATLSTAVFLIVICLIATFMRLETIAATSIGGLMTILSTYLWAETKRPSNRP